MLLMTIAAKSLSSVSAGVTRVAAVGTAGIRQVLRALAHRREVMRLAELDERGLKDIGLVRSDVDGALAASWLDDPSTVLAERSSSASGFAAARREKASRDAGSGPVPAVGADLAVSRCCA